MEVTRRFWAVAAVGVTLAGLAVVFARPILLAGAGGVAAVLLARQYWFLRALKAADKALTVDQSVPSQYVTKGDETPVTLSGRLGTPSQLDITVALSPPLLAAMPDDADGRITIPAGEQQAMTTVVLRWPVAGRTAFDPLTVTMTDPFGLFYETVPRGSEPTVTVEPRVPRNVHVGSGGDQVLASFGGHRSDETGMGTDPAEIREYVAGDSVSDIDWKATARLQYPHVRDYEVETDRQTVLIVDHRAKMTTGRTGETKLDYLREVALAIVENAADMNDPLGIATVDDNGTTTWEAPGTSPDTYDTVRSRLHDLDTNTSDPDAEPVAKGRHDGQSQSPATARRKATYLAGDESDYSRRLRPFFAESTGYVQRMDADPLFGTVRTRLSAELGSVWTLLFTDDTDRTQLREAVKLARQQSAHVVVFLTPSVLFERDGLAALDDAYESYVDFEDFRRTLAGLEGVTAFEVGPGDRIEAILDTRRRQRQ